MNVSPLSFTVPTIRNKLNSRILLSFNISDKRCFKNVKKLPVTYCANSKAWMTSEIFRHFLHALDASFGALGGKILLFADRGVVVNMKVQTVPD
jgi:hypothetical protein